MPCWWNTAIAVAGDRLPWRVRSNMAVEAARIAYESGLGAVNQQAIASSPLAAFLEHWHELYDEWASSIGTSSKRGCSANQMPMLNEHSHD